MKNKKTLFTSIGIIIAAIIVSIFAFVPIDRTHDVAHKTWMSRVDDSVRIKDLSIPGTHDSGATHSIADVAGKCQDISIATQLDIGVRFFDLRLQLVNDEFIITHDFVKQNLKFETVMNDLNSFITENKDEFILISIKQEASSVDSTMYFDDALKAKLLSYSSTVCLDSSLPETLGEARGKIYVLSRSASNLGIPAYSGWADDTTFELNDMYIQDDYRIQYLDQKRKAIQETIEYTNEHSDKLVLNFTSCYADPGFPPLYAGVVAHSINPWILNMFKSRPDVKLGIIVADFITEQLSYAIYMRNL